MDAVNMSKMPAKKKSCFQITSVTQAQVGAGSIPDDTESLDDPDEARTEDVSADIFDGSRPDLGVCERSTSEETVNTGTGEQQEAPPTGPINGGGPSYKSPGTGRTTPQSLGGGVYVQAPAPPVSTGVCPLAPVNTSCSSRFRVIKLDHGTGEPFRRGRWMCTEFYERDSDSSRTVDSIKPNVVPDPLVDRDSGLGTTSTSGVSAFSVQTVDNAMDGGQSVVSYSLLPQMGGGTSAFQPTGYVPTASQNPQTHILQPLPPHTFISNGIHKSPIMPPAYSTGLSAGQTEYCPQQFGPNTQNFTVKSVGPPPSQGAPPLVTSAGPGGQGQVREGAVAPGLHLHVSSPPVVAPVLPGGGQPQPVSQTQPSGGSSVPPVLSVTTTHSSIHNVPTTVPTTTNTPTGLTGLTLGVGGLVQPQGALTGATAGHPSNNQTEDSGQKADLLPQSSPGVVLGSDGGFKPLIAGRLGLPAPAVNTLFGIPISMDGDDDSSSGASVVAIDNKIEQAMDLVKSHLMYAVREEVEVLKEQIKELYERNSVLERENAVLKSLANSDQLGQLTNQLSQSSSTPSPPQQQHLTGTNSGSSSTLVHYDGVQSVPHQPNITSA